MTTEGRDPQRRHWSPTWGLALWGQVLFSQLLACRDTHLQDWYLPLRNEYSNHWSQNHMDDLLWKNVNIAGALSLWMLATELHGKPSAFRKTAYRLQLERGFIYLFIYMINAWNLSNPVIFNKHNWYGNDSLLSNRDQNGLREAKPGWVFIKEIYLKSQWNDALHQHPFIIPSAPRLGQSKHGVHLESCVLPGFQTHSQDITPLVEFLTSLTMPQESFASELGWFCHLLFPKDYQLFCCLKLERSAHSTPLT